MPISGTRMCGIAGFSLGPRADADPTALARILLAGIAERGADASGVAWITPDAGAPHVEKMAGGATALIPRLVLPEAVSAAVLHVRDFTKGAPHIEANNHPIRRGHVVGVHNGRILNDEEVLKDHGLGRAEPEATVDSEALFALLDLYGDAPGRALRRVRGPVAAAWLDERQPGALRLARGVGRPLVIAAAPDAEVAVFASTEQALDLVRKAGVPLRRSRPVGEATWLELVDGRRGRSLRFEPQPFVEPRATRRTPSPLERIRALHLVAGTTCWAHP